MDIESDEERSIDSEGMTTVIIDDFSSPLMKLHNEGLEQQDIYQL